MHNALSYTSDVFEMAAAIMNQAAIQCIALYPNNLTELPQHEIDFLKGVPTTWDRQSLLQVIQASMPW